MNSATMDQLKRVIESQHGGTASFHQSLRVVGTNRRMTDWDGIVHVFDLKNHPKTKRAYAWTAAITGGTKPRYFAVLHGGHITGPVDAVKAAATMIQTMGKRGKV
ncbi:MAG TPA: hypothetical protein VHC71_07780 [Hyphomicrobium sp.]|nr:hypothetical protein [Hyphomicrobium sp.]